MKDELDVLDALIENPQGLSVEVLCGRLGISFSEACMALVMLASCSPPRVLLKGDSGLWIISVWGRRYHRRRRPIPTRAS
jgi:hypothetical protein